MRTRPSFCFACLAALGAFTAVAIGCATSVNDDSLSGTGDVVDAGGVDAKGDGSHHNYNDSGSAGDTGGGQGDDASTPQQDATAPQDSGGGSDAGSGVDANPQPPDAAPPVDSGGGGSDVCPNNPIYSIEATAALFGSNPVMCTSNADCAATECCYGSLVCVAQ